ncbi:nuclear transport factor 2 family protein [Halobacillus sp. B23F22_1]|uniref:nuclear transport factor 2 family protein n=1 Tax=Halobacillus sp. B23F22_1 TaxID=3459514 RepID=UPI00373E6FDE
MNNDLREQLKEMEKRHLNLEVRRSTEELAQILAEDFWEIGSSGYEITRDECLKDGVVLSEMVLYQYKIQPLAYDVVLATYFIEDKTRNRNTRRSSIWKFVDERWQLYFHQGTITGQKVEDLKG